MLPHAAWLTADPHTVNIQVPEDSDYSLKYIKSNASQKDIKLPNAMISLLIPVGGAGAASFSLISLIFFHNFLLAISGGHVF